MNRPLQSIGRVLRKMESEKTKNKRFIKLSGAKNARDLGGIINCEGKKIKEHCFLRSEQLSSLSTVDQSILLGRYNLAAIIDLRTDVERNDAPDVEMTGVKNIHLPVFSSEVIGITHENNIDKRKMLDNLPDMSRLYRTIVTDSRCIESLRKIFEIITQVPDGRSVLWHCTEGKDRCGLVSALFLSLLDVPREEILSDYLLTNISAKKKSDVYYYLIKFLLGRPIEAQKVREIYLAKPEFFFSAFDAIDSSFGSVDRFLKEALGISDETKEKMKKRYLI